MVCRALPGTVAIMASVLTKTESAWADVSLGSRAWTVYKVIQILVCIKVSEAGVGGGVMFKYIYIYIYIIIIITVFFIIIIC